MVGGSAGAAVGRRRRQVALVDRDVLDADDAFVRLELGDAIDEQERVAVRQDALDSRVVERQLDVFVRHSSECPQYTSRSGGQPCGPCLPRSCAPVRPRRLAQTRPVTVDDVLELKAVASPMVSPDGTRVLYTVRGWEAASDKEPNQRESRTRIWMVPAGRRARPADHVRAARRRPAAVVAGRALHQLRLGARLRQGDDAPRPQIYVMRSDGGEARRLTDAKEGIAAYAWAPDSRRIAFVATDPRTAEETSAPAPKTTSACSRATSAIASPVGGGDRRRRRRRRG